MIFTENYPSMDKNASVNQMNIFISKIFVFLVDVSFLKKSNNKFRIYAADKSKMNRQTDRQTDRQT